MRIEYTVDYFIEKFTKIHSHKWIEGAYEAHGIESGTYRKCALGHCGEKDCTTNTYESEALRRIFRDAFNGKITPIEVNDDNVFDLTAKMYPEVTKIVKSSTDPRLRMIGVLKLIKRTRR